MSEICCVVSGVHPGRGAWHSYNRPGARNGTAAAEKGPNKIFITPVNLNVKPTDSFMDGSRVNQLNPALYFNLDVLVAADFDDYEESLQSLTACSGSRR
jgi:hypothetical protein